MKIPSRLLAALLLAATSGCGSSGNKSAKTDADPAAPATPAIPADVQSAAEAALGSETDVLAFGDLAKTGRKQILAINRLKGSAQGNFTGTLVTRVVVIENDGGNWKEIFRCDEHLKNTNGFLGATPLAAVGGWKLQTEQDPEKGLELYFTPLAKPEGGYIQTIGVRWNPQVKRYESLDRTYEHFLGEVPALETPLTPMGR
jgi:hypothetical protein